MSDNPTRILLIRHAVNDWVGKRLAGWTPGVHLNERGQAQAAALGQRLAGMKIGAVYASPLERAQETAAAIAGLHEGLLVRTAEGLGEARCGDWTGQAIEDLAKTDAWRQVQYAPSAFRFPNGESMVEIQTRMIACLQELAAAHPGETIIAVSHADPIKLVTAFYLGMPLDLFQRISISPASITEFAFSPFGAHLLCCNDTAHVSPEPEEEQGPPAEAAQPAETQKPPAGAAEPAASGDRHECENTGQTA